MTVSRPDKDSTAARRMSDASSRPRIEGGTLREQLGLDVALDGGVVAFPGLSLGRHDGGPNDTPNDTLTTVAGWLDAVSLSDLKSGSLRSAQRALQARRLDGSELIVREVIGAVGRGGKSLQVHVDSLPADLREAWYLAQGIDINAPTAAPAGAAIEVGPGQIDPTDEAERALARWRHDVIRPVLRHPAKTKDRAAALAAILEQGVIRPDGCREAISRASLYNWVKAYETQGLAGLMKRRRVDKGRARKAVTLGWDRFMRPHLDEAVMAEVGADLRRHIASMWASGAPGWRQITENSTTRLIEMTRDLRVLAFDQLDTGRLGDLSDRPTQFGVCAVGRRVVEAERDKRIIAIRDKDNATFQDEWMPSIRRDYSDLKPRDLVVGDVHPVDVMMLREDGRPVYPKAIAWYDVATTEVHMTFVLLEPKEGIRREHVAQSFEAMAGEWGLPRMLYLDNGAEYSWDDMIDGFTALSKVASVDMAVMDLESSPDVANRVRRQKQAVIRSRPYNAKGKPGIEGVFAVLEGGFFSTLQGWVAGDRMKKKTHAKGKDPIAFPGTASDFLREAGDALDHYHKRPQYGRLDGKSPNEVLARFVDAGWGKTVVADPNVLTLAFSTADTRVIERGRIQYTSARGETVFYYDDALMARKGKVTIRVPAYNPTSIFVFDENDDLICQAFPERTFGVLDPAGAAEVGRRAKVLRRIITEKRRHCALLELTDETRRHLGHLPDAPEVPVAGTVNIAAIDRMLEADRTATKTAIADADKPTPKIPSQWKTTAVQAEFLPDEEDDADE